MIARNKTELDAFNEMDRERYELEGKDDIMNNIMSNSQVVHPKHINYWLMQDFEVPDWLKVKRSDVYKDVTKDYGAGKWERKQVSYNDQLTDS